MAAAVFGALAPSLTQAGSADETSFLPHDAESLAARRLIATEFPSDSAASGALIVFSRTGGLTDADRQAIASTPSSLLRPLRTSPAPGLGASVESIMSWSGGTGGPFLGLTARA